MLDELNNQSSKKSASSIDEEMKKWPKSPYIEAAVAEARARPALGTKPAQSRRRISLLPIILAFVVVLSLLLFAYFRQPERKQSAGVGPTIQSPTSLPTPTPLSSFDPKTAKVEVGEQTNGPGYRLTPAVINTNGEDILRLVRYEFYSSRFIAGSTELKHILNDKSLKNEEELVSIFRSQKEELSNSWILIFTTASVERDPDFNSALCERRIYHVRDLIARAMGGAPRGYWGISAGEFKLQLPRGMTPEQEEAAEERIARKEGEQWLAPQRKLVVIAIKEVKPLAPELQGRVPFDVALSISSSDMLPKTYDAPESKPFPLGADATGQ